MEMGEKIKMLRKRNSMTLEELGNRVGVGKSTVRKWENGMIANMRRDKITKIASALDCSPAYLLGWEESESSSKDAKPLSLQVKNVKENISKEEQELLNLFHKLDVRDKEELFKWIGFRLTDSKYDAIKNR